MLSNNFISKWKVDLGGTSSRILSKNADPSLNPPGFSSGCLSVQQVSNVARNEQQQHLLSKRAWDLALQPLKSLPMNVFMMYMAGGTISIFPIMMIVMMAWRPVKALMAVNNMFRQLELEHNGSLILHKMLFVAGNLCVIALATYKCHSIGLLPTHASDWLDFVPPAKRLQYILSAEF